MGLPKLRSCGVLPAAVEFRGAGNNVDILCVRLCGESKPQRPQEIEVADDPVHIIGQVEACDCLFRHCAEDHRYIAGNRCAMFERKVERAAPNGDDGIEGDV